MDGMDQRIIEELKGIKERGGTIEPEDEYPKWGGTMALISTTPGIGYHRDKKKFFVSVRSDQQAELLASTKGLFLDAMFEVADNKSYLTFTAPQIEVAPFQHGTQAPAPQAQESETRPKPPIKRGVILPRGRGRPKLSNGEGNTVSIALRIPEKLRPLMGQGAQKRGYSSYSEYIRYLLVGDLTLLGIKGEGSIGNERQVYARTDALFRKKLDKLPPERRAQIMDNKAEVRRIKDEIRAEVREMIAKERGIVGP
jgi:Arc/MetJ-type ribon-helix-helix transcriptional regulator